MWYFLKNICTISGSAWKIWLISLCPLFFGSGVNLWFCLSLFTTTAKLVFSFKLMHFHRLCGWPVSHWQELFILTPGLKPANIYPPPLRFDSWNLTLLVRMIGNFPSLCLTLTLRGTRNYIQSSLGKKPGCKTANMIEFHFHKSQRVFKCHRRMVACQLEDPHPKPKSFGRF